MQRLRSKGHENVSGKGYACAHLLLYKRTGEEPGDDGEIAAFIVGGKNDGVFFLG